ncbi:hypothetical protein, partial [Haliscomenobacter sp.]|uniref:hypothetical protein n=1 Tax=Haliscomenobacter sp. TaxID=2717303 RepID=UPI0033651AB5
SANLRVNSLTPRLNKRLRTTAAFAAAQYKQSNTNGTQKCIACNIVLVITNLQNPLEAETSLR